jgi:DNA topoisomerase IA
VARDCDSRATCHGAKFRHITKRGVRKALRAARRKGYGRVTPYWCRQCHGWHVGH